MTAGKMSADQWHIYDSRLTAQESADKLSAYILSPKKLSAAELFAAKLSADKLSADQRSSHQMTAGQMSADQWHIYDSRMINSQNFTKCQKLKLMATKIQNS